MYEARIILPSKDNDGKSLGPELQAFRSIVSDLFGGCTEFSGQGVWKSGMRVYHDPVQIFDIACDASLPDIEKTLRDLASEFKIACRQKAVYLRLPNGQVEFI